MSCKNVLTIPTGSGGSIGQNPCSEADGSIKQEVLLLNYDATKYALEAAADITLTSSATGSVTEKYFYPKRTGAIKSITYSHSTTPADNKGVLVQGYKERITMPIEFENPDEDFPGTKHSIAGLMFNPRKKDQRKMVDSLIGGSKVIAIVRQPTETAEDKKMQEFLVLGAEQGLEMSEYSGDPNENSGYITVTLKTPANLLEPGLEKVFVAPGDGKSSGAAGGSGTPTKTRSKATFEKYTALAPVTRADELLP